MIQFPKIRKDLIIVEQETQSGKNYVIKDPLTQEYFEVAEPEYFIICRLDGIHTESEIKASFEEKFSESLPDETLADFISELSALGFLDEGTAGERKAIRSKNAFTKSRGLIYSLLYIPLPAFNPDRILNFLIKYFRFLYTKAFFIIGTFIILAGLWLTFLNGQELFEQSKQLWSFGGVVIIWFVFIWVIAIHEFSHGLTCKRFGGNVNAMGFLLIYFEPAFYCDVSDAWLFPKKTHRLWVTFAGIFSTLIIWGLAMIVWRITETGTPPNIVAIAIIAGTGLQSLFNLNPLLKYDGYFLLSDYVEIPNLRERSFAYINNSIKSWIGGKALKNTEKAEPRVIRIYWIYGLLAAFYSIAILSVFGYIVFNFLIKQYELFGFVLFLGILFLLFGKPLKNLAGFLYKILMEKDLKQTNTNPDKEAEVPKKKLYQKRWFKFISVIAVLFVLSLIIPWELKVKGSCQLRPIQRVFIRPEIPGVLHNIFVNEGQTVNQGDKIALLIDRVSAQLLDESKAQLEKAKAELEMLLNGARAEEIDRSEQQLEAAEIKNRFAREKLARYEKLYNDKVIPIETFDKIRNEAELAEKEYSQVECAHNLLIAPPRIEEVAKTQAKVSELESTIKHLQTTLKCTEITAPISGRIVTPHLEEKAGKYFNPELGEFICEIVDSRKILAEISVPENELGSIQTEFPVSIKIKGYPNMSFNSKVTRIGSYVSIPENNIPSDNSRIIMVSCEIDNPDNLLKPWMTGYARIYCGQHSVFSNIAYRLTRWLKIEFWGLF